MERATHPGEKVAGFPAPSIGALRRGSILGEDLPIPSSTVGGRGGLDPPDGPPVASPPPPEDPMKASLMAIGVSGAALFLLALVPATAEAQAPGTQPDTRMGFFVTSVGLGDGANLGGLDGADRHCQALASAVGAGDRT